MKSVTDLLFTQAGIGLTEVNRVNGICHGKVTDVFETELFGKGDCKINLNNPKNSHIKRRTIYFIAFLLEDLI